MTYILLNAFLLVSDISFGAFIRVLAGQGDPAKSGNLKNIFQSLENQGILTKIAKGPEQNTHGCRKTKLCQ